MKQHTEYDLLLIYDGQCVLCRNTVQKLERIKIKARMAMVSLQSIDEQQLPASVSKEALHAQLHVFDKDGKLFRGPDAVMRIMREVPSLRWISWMYAIPGMKPIAAIMYRWVAKHRYQLFGKVEIECNDGSCQWHPRK